MHLPAWLFWLFLPSTEELLEFTTTLKSFDVDSWMVVSVCIGMLAEGSAGIRGQRPYLGVAFSSSELTGHSRTAVGVFVPKFTGSAAFSSYLDRLTIIE